MHLVEGTLAKERSKKKNESKTERIKDIKWKKERKKER